MRNRAAASTLAVLALTALVALAGCRPSVPVTLRSAGEGKPAANGSAFAILSAASPDVSRNMGKFFAAGLLFMVLGGGALILGSRMTGLGLIALGFGTTAVGVLFTQYPWSVLVLLALAGVAVFAKAVEVWRLRRGGEVLIGVIEESSAGGKIKQGVRDRGLAAEKAVRSLVSPIKETLRRKGEIA